MAYQITVGHEHDSECSTYDLGKAIGELSKFKIGDLGMSNPLFRLWQYNMEHDYVLLNTNENVRSLTLYFREIGSKGFRDMLDSVSTVFEDDELALLVSALICLSPDYTELLDSMLGN
jgi:hypothetical protein